MDLSNVDIVSERFDVPGCETVQLARQIISIIPATSWLVFTIFRGKEEGIVLDNAGLWLEHGFCQQDRVWTLEGKKKRKRSSGFGPMVVAVDEDGIIPETHIPEKIEGMELIELTCETEDLLKFEAFLSFTLNKGHKPLYLL